MNIKYFFSILVILLSCNDSKKIDTNLLNGYWMIENVSRENEVFRLDNTTLVDFYKIKDYSGWRTKVKPLIDNSFRTSNNKVFIKIIKNEEKISLAIKTPWDNWEEELLKLDSISLILKIEDKIFRYIKIR
ncbi:MAG: hypothetical protein CMC81_04915 [Flavobacteriaceae bacterium]|nr:hypothetical protein [Flavobacteriaceae bacterium]